MVSYESDKGQHGWIQVARGSIDLNGQILNTGDGASLSDEVAIKVTATKQAEVLLFDLP